jgi:hypothetical protein
MTTGAPLGEPARGTHTSRHDEDTAKVHHDDSLSLSGSADAPFGRRYKVRMRTRIGSGGTVTITEVTIPTRRELRAYVARPSGPVGAENSSVALTGFRASI